MNKHIQYFLWTSLGAVAIFFYPETRHSGFLIGAWLAWTGIKLFQISKKK